jgi:hypothetical protein
MSLYFRTLSAQDYFRHLLYSFVKNVSKGPLTFDSITIDPIFIDSIGNYIHISPTTIGTICKMDTGKNTLNLTRWRDSNPRSSDLLDVDKNRQKSLK